MSNLAYKFKGSGFGVPEEKRKFENSENRVAKALSEWLDNRYDKKQPILDRIKEQKPTLEDINSAVLLLRERPNIREAGHFITELYSQLPEEEIVFDIETQDHINGLGEGLRKTLVNKGKIDCLYGGPRTLVNFGEACVDNHGDNVVNYGKFLPQAMWMINYGTYQIGRIKKPACEHLINFGKAKCDDLRDQEMINGLLAINFGELTRHDIEYVIAAKGSVNKGKGRILRQRDLDKIGFEGYLPMLQKEVERGRTDYHAALEVLKALKGEKSAIQLPSIPTLLERLKNG